MVLDTHKFNKTITENIHIGLNYIKQLILEPFLC